MLNIQEISKIISYQKKLLTHKNTKQTNDNFMFVYYFP